MICPHYYSRMNVPLETEILDDHLKYVLVHFLLLRHCIVLHQHLHRAQISFPLNSETLNVETAVECSSDHVTDLVKLRYVLVGEMLISIEYENVEMMASHDSKVLEVDEAGRIVVVMTVMQLLLLLLPHLKNSAIDLVKDDLKLTHNQIKFCLKKFDIITGSSGVGRSKDFNILNDMICILT